LSKPQLKVFSILSFLYILQDQGFSQAIIQRQDLEPEHLDTAFWTNIGIGILLTLICVIPILDFGLTIGDCFSLALPGLQASHL